MNRQKLIFLLLGLTLTIGWLINSQKFNFLKTDANIQQNIPVTAMNPPPQKEIEPRLLKANTEFAFKLFSQIITEEKGKNVFISPNSVAIALSLLYNGAADETKQQMADVLVLQDMTLEEINQAYSNLQANLESNKEVELSIANSIWIRKGFPVAAKFLENNQQYYQAKISELDFNKQEALTTINNWVNEETKGKIDTILDSISPENVLFLINAIYFKGSWSTEFDPKLTQQQPFYLEEGKTINHPLMSQTGEKSYYENDEFQAIQLPYGEDQSLSMYIFLPKEKSNLNNFMQLLTAENWQNWQNNFSKKEGFISLPKFKLEYEISLKDTLQRLGMTSIFSDDANFKNMTSKKVNVDEVKHKTFVEVNEEGTEAAAVTSIGIRVTSIDLNEPFKMIVNRPFFYAITDNKTGSILFMGQTLDPR